MFLDLGRAQTAHAQNLAHMSEILTKSHSHFSDPRRIGKVAYVIKRIKISRVQWFSIPYYSRTPIYRDARGKGFCPVNRGARYIGVKYRKFPILGEVDPPGKSGFR